MAAVSTIFRFLTIRNPRKPSKEEIDTGFVRYDVALNAPLTKRVADAKQGPDPRRNMLAAIRAFVNSSDYFRDLQSLENRNPALSRFVDFLNETGERITKRKLVDRLAIEHPTVDLTTEQLLWDNLLAYVFAGGIPEIRERIVRSLVALNLIRAGSPPSTTDATVLRLAGATVLLSSEVQVNPEHIDAVDAAPAEAESESDRDRALARIRELESAYADVSARYAAVLEAARAREVDPIPVPKEGEICFEPPKLPDPVPVFDLGVMNAAFLRALTEATRKVLSELGIQEGQRVPFALKRIEEETNALARTVWQAATTSTRIIFTGGGVWAYEPPIPGQAVPVIPPDRVDVDYSGMYDDPSCRVKPLGIGDFRRVEQEVICYEPGEVAHIENVLLGESKERTTRFLRRTEQIFVSTTEEETTKERDTQTTDRYEVEKESSKVVKDDIAFSLGVQITAQYGVVKINADTKFAYTHSTTESDKDASRYAKEVTDRSVERVVRRVREEQTKKLLEEYEDTNKHSLSNVGGTGHIVGLYRWVDKVYLAKIVNYGKRLMLEFLVPEPAAFHLYAMARSPIEQTLTIEKPVDPTSPETVGKYGFPPLKSHLDLNAGNYAGWAAVYGAKIDPIPEAFLTVSKAYNRDAMDQDVPFSESKNDLKIPEGYQAQSYVGGIAMHTEGSNWLTVGVGYNAVYTQTGIGIAGPNHGEDDIIPVIVAGRTKMYALSLEITCARKTETNEAWQIKTFNAILKAYQEKLGAYQAALAEAKVQAGNSLIRGTNPLLNRQVEQTELKKGCIRLMDPHCNPVASEAMKFRDICGEQGKNFPEFDCCTAIRDGAYVQFLEQCIEWDLMTYLFYPYFWARKCGWKQLYQISDADPVFEGFLKAGYARVVVPVRPGYETSVLRFLVDGIPWNGGTTPGVESPLYVAIANEMKEPVGTIDPDVKPWEIRVPTTLTVLQCDSGCVPGTGLPCDRPPLGA